MAGKREKSKIFEAGWDGWGGDDKETLGDCEGIFPQQLVPDLRKWRLSEEYKGGHIEQSHYLCREAPSTFFVCNNTTSLHHPPMHG